MCVRGFDGKGPWWAGLLGLLIAGEERTASGAKSTRKPLGRGLSSYQLFRAALDFLGNFFFENLIHTIFADSYLAKHEFGKDHVYLRSQDGHRVRFVVHVVHSSCNF